MKVNVDIHLIVNGAKTIQRGDFQVRKQEDIPKVAHNFIMASRRESGYYGHQSLIEKVIIDGDKDITDEVKAIDEAPIEDLDDIFW